MGTRWQSVDNMHCRKSRKPPELLSSPGLKYHTPNHIHYRTVCSLRYAVMLRGIRWCYVLRNPMLCEVSPKCVPSIFPASITPEGFNLLSSLPFYLCSIFFESFKNLGLLDEERYRNSSRVFIDEGREISFAHKSSNRHRPTHISMNRVQQFLALDSLSREIFPTLLSFCAHSANSWYFILGVFKVEVRY